MSPEELSLYLVNATFTVKSNGYLYSMSLVLGTARTPGQVLRGAWVESRPSARLTLAVIPGPSILQEKLQGFQHLQSGLLLGSIIYLQVTNDDSLQPFQVPDT